MKTTTTNIPPSRPLNHDHSLPEAPAEKKLPTPRCPSKRIPGRFQQLCACFDGQKVVRSCCFILPSVVPGREYLQSSSLVVLLPLPPRPTSSVTSSAPASATSNRKGPDSPPSTPKRAPARTLMPSKITGLSLLRASLNAERSVRCRCSTVNSAVLWRSFVRLALTVVDLVPSSTPPPSIILQRPLLVLRASLTLPLPTARAQFIFKYTPDEHLRKPTARHNGWLKTATHILKRAECRGWLLVYNAIGCTYE